MSKKQVIRIGVRGGKITKDDGGKKQYQGNPGAEGVAAAGGGTPADRGAAAAKVGDNFAAYLSMKAKAMDATSNAYAATKAAHPNPMQAKTRPTKDQLVQWAKDAAALHVTAARAHENADAHAKRLLAPYEGKDPEVVGHADFRLHEHGGYVKQHQSMAAKHTDDAERYAKWDGK